MNMIHRIGPYRTVALPPQPAETLKVRNMALQSRVSSLRRQLDEVNRAHQLETAALRTELERWKSLSEKDPLTGLYTVHAFKQKLVTLIDGAFRYDRGFSLAFIDLDSFKKVNDRNGHQAGDLALKQVADILSKRLRGTDFAGRYGGDELVMILDETFYGNAITPLEAVRQMVQNSPLPLDDGTRLQLTVSIGFSQLLPPGEKKRLPLKEIMAEKKRLIREADTALYASKYRGKNQVTPFSEEVRRYVEEQRDLKRTGNHPAIV